ncbi:AraC family transcriptional regulator [Cryobacterium adonitolivorans]|uniref:AraC family transcriptional regulator n=1 Tax=Cryobacterium adonitolivorans TaxID=1259189 RepID=A0A4R8WA33_9MICO|nr:helix-turn-helix domain-containing protein [Cryobacterium adonitolivorans]TFC03754.1 AraC family transcriptional regulator [Cryobacterium adonitolivorans]
MAYLEVPVPADLAPEVLRLWYLEQPVAQRYERIFPQPALHLIVNLSDPYRLFDLRSGAVRTLGAGFLSGLQPRFLMTQGPPAIRHVAAELAPFAAARFLGLPAAELTGTVRESQGLLGDTDALREAARQASDPAAAVALLITHLRALQRPNTVPPAVVRAWAGIHQNPDAPMPVIAAAAGLSHHRLIDEFRSWCGVTPKVYADIVRFSQFIQALPLQGSMPSWADLVATSGYYDQPHFIRVFRAFTGFSPSRYLDIVARYGADYAAFVPLDELDGVPSPEVPEFSTRRTAP